jgi:hypothetical protein
MANTVIRDYSIPAGEQLPIMIPGKFMMVLEAASALDIEILRNNSVKGNIYGVEASFTFGPVAAGNEFHGMKIKSADGTAQTVKIGISDDVIGYQVMAGSISASVTPGSQLDSAADVSIDTVTTALVSAANSNRKDLVIANLAANLSTMRIGDAGAGAANGIELAPGAAVTLTTAAAVYAYNPGASAESLAVLEINQ